MPYQWTGIGSSTATQRRQDLHTACQKQEYAGADLIGNHVFKDAQGNLFVLVKLPNDAGKHEDFLREIKAQAGGVHVVDTDGN